MRADGGEGGTVDPRPWAGRTCESCGRQVATEVLRRRLSRYGRSTKQRIEHQVLLCYQCWLDILCGLKPMPPEREPLSSLGTASRPPARAALVLRRERGTVGELSHTASREFREPEAAYASTLQAHGRGQQDRGDQVAFARAAGALPRTLAQESRARRRGMPRSGWQDSAHSAAFLRLRSAREALQESRAHGLPARQERAEFHEALSGFRHHVASVCLRARRLRAQAGIAPEGR